MSELGPFPPAHPAHLVDLLQEYVRTRVRQFAKDFAEEVVPDLPEAQLEAITARILARAGSPPALLTAPSLGLPVGMGVSAMGAVGGIAPAPAGPLALEFRHDCLCVLGSGEGENAAAGRSGGSSAVRRRERQPHRRCAPQTAPHTLHAA